MVEDIVREARSHVGFLLAVTVTLVLVVGAMLGGVTLIDRFVSLAVICLGYATGAAVGTAISPVDDGEAKRFAGYGRAVVAFATGYVASKLDGVVNVLSHSPQLLDPSGLTLFRALAFGTMMLVTARTTLTCRSYD